MPDVLLDDQTMAVTANRRFGSRRTSYSPFRRTATPPEDGRRLVRGVIPTREQMRGANASCWQGHLYRQDYIWRTYSTSTCPQCGAESSNRLAGDRYERMCARRYRRDEVIVNNDRNRRIMQARRTFREETGRPPTYDEDRTLMREVRRRPIQVIEEERTRTIGQVHDERMARNSDNNTPHRIVTW